MSEELGFGSVPRRYDGPEGECIDYIRARLGDEGFIAYCRGNIIKYHWRQDDKGGQADLDKANWYSQMIGHVKYPDDICDPRDYRGES